MKPEELVAWRKEAGLTQVELAGALDLHEMTISRYERGVRKIPGWLPRLLATLRVVPVRRIA